MNASLKLLVPTLFAATLLTGCQYFQRDSGVADVPPPPASYEPAPADPFAPSPGYAPAPAPAPVVAAPPAASAPVVAGGGTYVVQRGETLWQIATRVYGDGQRWRDIAAANPGVNPDRIQAGQTIVLP